MRERVDGLLRRQAARPGNHRAGRWPGGGRSTTIRRLSTEASPPRFRLLFALLKHMPPARARQATNNSVGPSRRADRHNAPCRVRADAPHDCG
jgi:hypothetical protein